MTTCLISRKCFRSKLISNVGKRAYTAATDCDPKPDLGRKGVILGVYCCPGGGENKLTKTAEKFNTRTCGKLKNMLDAAGFLKKGKAHVFNNIDAEYWAVAIVGIGEECKGYEEAESMDVGKEDVRVASAAGATRLRKEGVNHIFIEDMGHCQQAAEGACLACWRFQENMLKSNWRTIPALESFECTDREAWTRGIILAEAQNLCRKLCDMPANQLTPTTFAQATVDALCPCGITVEVRDKDWIEDQCMNTFLTVAKGSCEAPLFLELIYCGGCKDDKPVLLIGTGVTFDSGGLHLKKCHNMDKYRGSMAGAGVVVAAMRAAAAMQLPINVIGLVPLCENMPSGLAMKPGDVVQALNGQHIMIQNCDNEGHLVLADTFTYGIKAFKPKLVVDISTLTSCVRAALGAGASGVFSNNKKNWTKLHKASAETGDRVWRLPLWKFYTRELVSKNAFDITNKGDHYGDASIAAAFLNEFVKKTKVDWMHIDITGVGLLTRTPNTPYLRIGRMTGRPTRTIIQFLKDIACEGRK